MLAKLKSAGLWILGGVVFVLGILTALLKAKADRTKMEMEYRRRKAQEAKTETLQRAQAAQSKAAREGEKSIQEAIDEANNPDNPRDRFTGQL